MVKFRLAEQRVGRFRGKQTGPIERLAESAFLSKRHIDWSKTRAYAQGNFGQIFINQKGRQPHGCVEPADVRPLLDDLKAGCWRSPTPRRASRWSTKSWSATTFTTGRTPTSPPT